MKTLITLALLIASGISQAMVLQGNGTITESELRALSAYQKQFGSAGLLVKEYCYFDAAGNPKNRGKCKAVDTRVPNGFSDGNGEKEYARQYNAQALGEPVANPEVETIYLNSFPDLWVACNNTRAMGCTYTEQWPEKVTVFVTTFDKKLGGKVMAHEIEYHALRNISH